MLSHRDFARKTKYNIDTQNQIWMSGIADSHDSWCDCNTPFSHLLSSIFPPGHQDRDKTINQILERDYKELCLSGGKEETDGGAAATATAGDPPDAREEDYIEDKDIEDLLDAAKDAEGLR